MISFCLGGVGKYLGESFALLIIVISNNVSFQDFESENTISNTLKSTNLKIFPNHGGLYRFDTVLKKTGECASLRLILES